ncbi:MAG: hypothetical protein ACR2PX_01685 [Endozoicomonas sp.]|uniref:hypothetical protein n=1 Tax=Endozoicomonas sp. TaxID=1892382 RepID=UPI003D9B1924
MNLPEKIRAVVSVPPRPAVICLVVVYVALLLEWCWLWGLMLLLWGLLDLVRQSTWLIIPVARKEFPVVYFAIVITWILLGGYWLYLDAY